MLMTKRVVLSFMSCHKLQLFFSKFEDGDCTEVMDYATFVFLVHFVLFKSKVVNRILYIYDYEGLQ